ncbi:MAG: hypothetical protein PHV34_10290 [Verrucomicrobiae bacterium]|nr:hypothetical protein [Verrucomicrobiae bacterium]
MPEKRRFGIPAAWDSIVKIDTPAHIKRRFADSLFAWGRRLSENNLMGPHSDGLCGSLSYRHALGMVITSPPARMDRLSDHDLRFIEVLKLQQDGGGVLTSKPPDAIQSCHALAYQSQGGVIFVFHVIDPRLEKAATKVGLIAIDSDPAANPSCFQAEFETQLARCNVIAVRNRGVFSLGCTAEDAGEQIMRLCLKLKT